MMDVLTFLTSMQADIKGDISSLRIEQAAGFEKLESKITNVDLKAQDHEVRIVKVEERNYLVNWLASAVIVAALGALATAVYDHVWNHSEVKPATASLPALELKR